MADGAGKYRSGKAHRDENFPVASWVIRKRHRPAILAFYDFVRVADDIADHRTLDTDEKLFFLNNLEQSLDSGRGEPEGVALHRVLHERGLSPQHARDLLTAFRLDVTKRRYEDWDDLMGYCTYSAMPVGRFVLDVHGESRAAWPLNDQLCAALQIINHLQDCAADYRNLDRVYIPCDALAAAGTSVETLGEPKAPPPLRACIASLAWRTHALLEDSRPFAASVKDTRLALEIAVIQTLAERLVKLLARRDPLSEKVHLGKPAVVGWSVAGLIAGLSRRMIRPRP